MQFKGRKVFLQDLILETTRECNQECAHCMRDEKGKEILQNRTVDNILGQTVSIDRILFTGGEPFLRPEIIGDVARSISFGDDTAILRSWAVVTNGTIWNDNVGAALWGINRAAVNYFPDPVEAVVNMSRGRTTLSVGQIAISDTEHHKKAREQAGISEERFRCMKEQIKEEAQYLGAQFLPNYKLTQLLNMGRARNLQGEKVEPSTEPSFRTQRLPSGLTDVKGIVYVDANGNICPMNLSYKEQEKHIFGNVNDASLSEILEDASRAVSDKPISVIREL